MKRTIPLSICFIIAVVLIGEYYINTGTSFQNLLQKWAVDVVAWTTLLALLTSTRNNIVRISRRRPEWQYDTYQLFLLWAMVLIGFFLGPTSEIYSFLVQNVMGATYAAIMASVGFFILPSVYRAFRIRNLESFIMLVSALTMIISQVSIGQALFSWAMPLRNWMLSVPVSSSQRGVLVAAAVGYIGILTRSIIGIETSWLGRDEG